jgi:ribose 5-phosphate isomerase B
LARSHNDANICSIPARFIDIETARDIVDAFLETDYEGGRHDIRVKQIPMKK